MTTDEWIKAHIEELTNDGPTHEVQHIELGQGERFMIDFYKVIEPNGPRGFWLPPIYEDGHDYAGLQFMSGLLRFVSKHEHFQGIPMEKQIYTRVERFMKDMIIADLAEPPKGDLDSFAHAMCRIADCRLLTETRSADFISSVCTALKTPMLIQPLVTRSYEPRSTLDRFRTSQLVIAIYEEG